MSNLSTLKQLWIAYVTVMHAAQVIRDPTEKQKMRDRANKRLKAYFEELERYAFERKDWVEW